MATQTVSAPKICGERVKLEGTHISERNPMFQAFKVWWERRYSRIDDGGWPTRGETVEEC